MKIATKEAETLYTASSVAPSGVVTVSVSIMALRLTKKRIFNPAIPIKNFPQSRNPVGFHGLIPIPVMNL